MIKKATSLWNNYLNFLLKLPSPADFIAVLATVIIPMFLCAGSISFVVDSAVEDHCLDSTLPRRYSDVCEEFQDGKWIEVSAFGGRYIYNDAASRENQDDK